MFVAPSVVSTAGAPAAERRFWRVRHGQEDVPSCLARWKCLREKKRHGSNSKQFPRNDGIKKGGRVLSEKSNGSQRVWRPQKSMDAGGGRHRHLPHFKRKESENNIVVMPKRYQGWGHMSSSSFHIPPPGCCCCFFNDQRHTRLFREIIQRSVTKIRGRRKGIWNLIHLAVT